MKKKTNEPTKLIRPKLSDEEKKKKIEIDEALRAKRDEGKTNVNLLISEVPSELKEEYKEHIFESNRTSNAHFTFSKLEMERETRNWSDPDRDDSAVRDDRDDVWGNWWWKTDALIEVGKKGFKRDRRDRRKKALKSFLQIVFGIRLANRINTKRRRKKDEKKMIDDFFDNVSLDEFRHNRTKPLSENLIDFLGHVVTWKKWGLVFPIAEKYEFLHKFKNDYEDKEAIMEHSKLTKRLVSDLYDYFIKNH